MRPRLLLGLLTAVALAAPVTASPIIDPSGDTIGGAAAHVDIVNSPGFVNLGGGVYQLTVNFAGPISPPSAGAPNSVIALIDLDLDRNPTTGLPSWTEAYTGSPLNLGTDAYISLFDELVPPGGFAGLYDNNDVLIASLPLSFGSNSFTVTLPLSAIGGIGAFNYSLVSFGYDDQGNFILDRAPNGVDPYAIPEPASMAVLALFASGALGATLRRRRSGAAPTAASTIA